MAQTDQIATHLKRHGAITPIQALNRYGCFRLAARINDLRDRGLGIETTIIEKDGKRFARYTLHD